MAECERLGRRGVEVSVVLSLGQLGRARHEDHLGRRGWRGPQVDVVEGGLRSDGRRRRRSHFLALSEAQVVA